MLMNNTTTKQRYRWLVHLSFAITLLLTWRFWSSARSFPTAPLFTYFDFTSLSFDYALIGIMAGLAIITLFYHNRGMFIALCALLIVGCMRDLNRLRPDFYHWFVCFLLFALLHKNDEARWLRAMRILVIGTYFFTGLQKMNLYFVERTGNFFLQTIGLPESYAALKYAVLLIPVWEILIAVSFLRNRRTKLAVASSVAMHGIIIAQLLFSGWNEAMIPYNIFLVLGNFLLFWKDNEAISLRNVFGSDSSLAVRVSAVLFFALPWLNFIGFWPHYMSAGMYSARSEYCAIYMDERLENNLPKEARNFVGDSPNGRYLDISRWLESETGCVPNPERIVYERTFAYVRGFCPECECRMSLYR